jgi:hypothetical protein
MAIHIAALAACVLALILYYVRRRRNTKYSIPWARSSIPLIGNAIEWGADPLQFLLKQKDLVGDVFRVNLVLIKITFVIGSRVSRAQYVRRLCILKDAPLQWNHWLMQELSEDDASAYQTLPALSCGVISQAHVQRGLPHHVCKTIRLGKCSIQARSYGANHILRTGSTPPARQQDIAKLSLNLAQPAFEDWASQPEIDFFAETSDLLLRITFATCFGEDFAYTHDGELFAIMKALQEGLMNPCSRIFPLWASPSGRGILRAQASLQRMLMAEVQVRLKDWDACREAKDYLSFLLVSNGEKGFVETDSELAAHFVSLMLPTIPVNKVLTNSFAALSSGLLLHYRTRKHGRYIRLDGTAPAAQSRCLVSFRGRDSGQPAQRGRHLSDKEYATQRRMHQRNGTPLRPRNLTPIRTSRSHRTRRHCHSQGIRLSFTPGGASGPRSLSTTRQMEPWPIHAFRGWYALQLCETAQELRVPHVRIRQAHVSRGKDGAHNPSREPVAGCARQLSLGGQRGAGPRRRCRWRRSKTGPWKDSRCSLWGPSSCGQIGETEDATFRCDRWLRLDLDK